jgi:hypothetical protein
VFESEKWYKEVTVLTIFPFVGNLAVIAVILFVLDALDIQGDLDPLLVLH